MKVNVYNYIQKLPIIDSDSFIEDFDSSNELIFKTIQFTKDKVEFSDSQEVIDIFMNKGDSLSNIFGGNSSLFLYNLLKVYPNVNVLNFHKFFFISFPKDSLSLSELKVILSDYFTEESFLFSFKDISDKWSVMFIDNFPILSIYKSSDNSKDKFIISSLDETKPFYIFPDSLENFVYDVLMSDYILDNIKGHLISKNIEIEEIDEEIEE